MQPWRNLDEESTKDGKLVLRQRGERDFLLTIDGRVLMSSMLHRSEDSLAKLAFERIGCEHRGRQRAERTGCRNRQRQTRILRAGHRRLDQPQRGRKPVHRAILADRRGGPPGTAAQIAPTLPVTGSTIPVL